MNKTRWIANIVEIVLGVILLIFGMMGTIDEFWHGMGVALIFVGILQMIRSIRYHSNPEYKETYDVAIQDERNKFLRIKAWSWAGYLYVLTAAVATIVFQIIGKQELATAAGFSVCIIMVFHWLSYLYLQKKY